MNVIAVVKLNPVVVFLITMDTMSDCLLLQLLLVHYYWCKFVFLASATPGMGLYRSKESGLDSDAISFSDSDRR